MVKKIQPPGPTKESPESKVHAEPDPPTPSPTTDDSSPPRKERADSLAPKEGGFLKTLGAGMKVLNKMTAPPPRGGATRHPNPTPNSNNFLTEERISALFEISRADPAPLFSALTYAGQRRWTTERFSANIRIAVLKRLLSNDPKLSIHDRNDDEETLAHAVITNPTLDGAEQATLIHFLADEGLDFSLCDNNGLNPLDLAVDLADDDIEYLAVRALQERGAHFSLNERIPIIGHFIGGWGHVPIDTPEGTEQIRLEGLTPTFAEYGLDPVFQDIITQVRGESSPPVQKVLAKALKAWDNNRIMLSLVDHIQRYNRHRHTENQPEMVTTGWALPTGHAVGLVGNPEADGYYLYACNTGISADPKRSIVRYKVNNPYATCAFLRRCMMERDHIRLLFTEETEDKGLIRCDKADQLPKEMEKDLQKHSNCPLAARKACLLAIMWSCGRADNIPDDELRQTYKKITTLIREHGVRETLDVGNPILMGKALIKMLTKIDRPACHPLAWELTLALKKHYQQDEGEPLPAEAPPITSKLFIKTVGKVLKLTDLRPNHIYTKGRTLAQHARHKGNPKAAKLLDHYSKPMDGVSKFLRLDYWDSLVN